MGDLIFLSEAQMRRIARYFPLSHGMRGQMTGGIVFVIRNGLRCAA